MKITPEGQASTFASGLQHPRGLVFDSSNNLFVTDKYAGIVYKIFSIPISIDAILTFFDQSVSDGSIKGYGHGNSANNRLNALRTKLQMTSDLIDIGDIDGACFQLELASENCDGIFPPPDFVQGESVPELYDMISELMTELGCE